MQQVLTLVADEVMLLTDRVLNQDKGTEDMAVSVYPLLLKLGSAYVEAFGDGSKRPGEIYLGVSEAELWLLRSKIVSADKMATDTLLGVKLLVKIYRGLLAYNTEGVAIGALPDGPAEEDVKLSDSSKRELGEWIEQHKD